MRTFMPKKGDGAGRWFVVDAEGRTLGRLATSVARVLMGKASPRWAPHVDVGDHVIVVNAARVRMTGKKWSDKFISRHSGYPGGLKQESALHLHERKPTALVEEAVRGMLPGTKLARSMMRKLKVYAGPEHPHQAQLPQPMASESELGNRS